MEWIKALKRESYTGLGDEFHESAFSGVVSYHFVLHKRRVRGGGNYAGRKSRIQAHPIHVTARYEYFNDGGLSEAARSWTLKDRVSLGVRYSFSERENVVVYLAGEYRYADYRTPAEAAAVLRENNEMYLRIGFDF